MKLIPKQLAACASVTLLGAAGLFGAVTHAQKPVVGHDRFLSEVETVLGMTPAQRDQAQAAVQSARQSAEPVRRELRDTQKALASAVRSDDTATIQRLSTTEGQELGHLMAIRNSTMAKVYKTLTPEQRQKADALHQVLMRGFHREMAHSGSHVAS